MPQGDYDEALKRALHYISAEWLKIFNAGKGGGRVGWDDSMVLSANHRDFLTFLYLPCIRLK